MSGSTGSRRREAFETEVRKVKGLVASPTLIRTSVDFGQEAVAHSCADAVFPTAIICGADIIALGVLRGLSDRHIDVPSQVKVTGFDGPLWEFCEPPITTASQPVEAIAGEAVDLLRARLSGDVSPPHRHEIAPVLKVRRSSRAMRLPSFAYHNTEAV